MYGVRSTTNVLSINCRTRSNYVTGDSPSNAMIEVYSFAQQALRTEFFFHSNQPTE